MLFVDVAVKKAAEVQEFQANLSLASKAGA
jgi:hypothetical protein